MTHTIDMQRPNLHYLVGMLPQEDRDSILVKMKCGGTIEEIVSAIVDAPEGLSAISDTVLVSHDIFWMSLVEAIHPPFYNCARAIDLPCPEKSDHRSTSVWRDLYNEIRAILDDRPALLVLDSAISSLEVVNLVYLANYRLVTHTLCQKELAISKLDVDGYFPIIPWCIKTASPVCLGLDLSKDQKWLLFLSSMRLGRMPIVRALLDEKEFGSMSGSWRIFDAASLSPYEGAMELALGFVTSSKDEITELLGNLVRRAKEIHAFGAGSSVRRNNAIRSFGGSVERSFGRGVEGSERLNSIPHPVAVVRALVMDGRADISGYDNFLLVWASEKGHKGLVALILAAPGFVPSERSGDALRYAASSGHEEVVTLLLSHESVTVKMKQVAAKAAVLTDCHATVQLFLSIGAVHPYFVLSACCFYGRKELLDVVLAKIKTRSGELRPYAPWMHNIFIWDAEPHPTCARSVVSALSLDLIKGESVLVGLIEGFKLYQTNELNREEGMKCLLHEIGISTTSAHTTVQIQEYGVCIHLACEMYYRKVLDVLLDYGTAMDLEIPELTIDRCMERAIENTHLSIIEAILKSCKPTPRAHGRWISSPRPHSAFSIRILEMLLSKDGGASLPEATTACVVAVINEDTEVLRAFMGHADFDISADDSLLLRMALSQRKHRTLRLILSDTGAANGMDDGGIENLFASILRINDNELLELALAQDLVKSERLKDETLEKIAEMVK